MYFDVVIYWREGRGQLLSGHRVSKTSSDGYDVDECSFRCECVSRETPSTNRGDRSREVLGLQNIGDEDYKKIGSAKERGGVEDCEVWRSAEEGG